MLDIDNELHLWALHYVYIPRINRRLTAFSNQWNQHGLRTVRHQSPLQIVIRGCLTQQRRPTTAIQDIFSSAPPRAGGEMDSTTATTEMAGRHGFPAQEGDTAGTREGGASTGLVPSIDWNNWSGSPSEPLHSGRRAYSATCPTILPAWRPQNRPGY